MADAEKVIGQITNLDDRIKQKKAEVKELENKRAELQSRWINDLMAKNNMSFNDLAELVTEKKTANNDIAGDKEISINAETQTNNNTNYQNKHN